MIHCHADALVKLYSRYQSHHQSTQEIFPGYHMFFSSVFITSQSVFVPANVVLKRYVVC